jgi:hypothetical protein
MEEEENEAGEEKERAAKEEVQVVSFCFAV